MTTTPTTSDPDTAPGQRDSAARRWGSVIHSIEKGVYAGALSPRSEAAVAGLREISTWQTQYRQMPATSTAAVVDRTIEAMLNGEERPSLEDLSQIALEAERAPHNHMAGLQMLDRMRERMAEALKRSLRDDIDGMLDILRVRFDETVVATRLAIVALGDLAFNDPDAVAQATDTQRQAMLDLKRLRASYRSVRGDQRDLLTSVWRSPAASNSIDGDAWDRVLKARVHEFREVHNRVVQPDPELSVEWWRNLADRDDTWLPTTEQLENAWQLYAGSYLEHPAIVVAKPTPPPTPRPRPGALLSFGS